MTSVRKKGSTGTHPRTSPTTNPTNLYPQLNPKDSSRISDHGSSGTSPQKICPPTSDRGMLPTSQRRIKRDVHSTSERERAGRQPSRAPEAAHRTVRMQGSRARAVGRLVSRGCLGPSVAHVVDGNALARLAVRALHRIRHPVPAHICSKAPPWHHEQVSSQNREGWRYAGRKRRRKPRR